MLSLASPLILLLLAMQPATPQMPAAIVERIVTVVEQQDSSFESIEHPALGPRRVLISSSRQWLARELAGAKAGGLPLKAPSLNQPDVLLVQCGNSDSRQLYQCAKVTVKNAAGSVIAPLTHRAAVNTYYDAAGVSWKVAEVTNSYHISALRRGFVVAYQDTKGVASTVTVSATDAAGRLMLRQEW
jgi:hypothetical protein